MITRNAVWTRFFSALSSTRFSSTANRYKKRGHKNTGIPPAFTSKINDWLKLLRHEIEYEQQRAKEFLATSGGNWIELADRGIGLGFLRFKQEYRCPINGRMVVLTRSSIADARAFQIGVPVLLSRMEDLKPLSECIWISSNRTEIVLKMRSNVNLELQKQLAIFPSMSSGASQSLMSLLSDDLAKKCVNPALIQYAFNHVPMPSIHNDRIPHDLPETFNDSQKRAVAAALNKRRPFTCIQGPPGTGKTRVIGEIVKRLTEKNYKVLVTAPTRVAVNNALNQTLRVVQEKLSEEEDSDFAKAETLDMAMELHDKYGLLHNLSQRIHSEGYFESDETLRALKKQFNQLKHNISCDVYRKRRAIFCTLSSSAVQKLQYVNWEPDVLIIDEAAQCTEPSAWAAIVRAKRCILVGDHAQLPPFAASEEAIRGGLKVSLMERLTKEYSNSNISYLLNIQYRMNRKIMQWSSHTFYESQLLSDDSVADRTISEISDIEDNDKLNSPMILFNTDLDKNGPYREELFNFSYRNHEEAKLLVSYLEFLLKQGVDPSSVAIISPYYAQVALIRSLLVTDEVAVNSVDAFQGQEKNIILFSMVRHNDERQVGFVRDPQRLNVAITRARHQFALFGSCKMMNRHKLLNSLQRYIMEKGKILHPALITKRISMIS